MNPLNLLKILKCSKDKGIQDALEDSRKKLESELDRQLNVIRAIQDNYCRVVSLHDYTRKLTEDESSMRIYYNPIYIPELCTPYFAYIARDQYIKDVLSKLVTEYEKAYQALKELRGY